MPNDFLDMLVEEIGEQIEKEYTYEVFHGPSDKADCCLQIIVPYRDNGYWNTHTVTYYFSLVRGSMVGFFAPELHIRCGDQKYNVCMSKLSSIADVIAADIIGFQKYLNNHTGKYQSTLAFDLSMIEEL